MDDEPESDTGEIYCAPTTESTDTIEVPETETDTLEEPAPTVDSPRSTPQSDTNDIQGIQGIYCAMNTDREKEGLDSLGTLEGKDGDEKRSTPQIASGADAIGVGDVALPAAAVGLLSGARPFAYEETRAKAANRWILEGRRWETDRFRQDMIRRFRAEGMTKEAASDAAWKACLAQFPPPGSPIPAAPDLSTIVDTEPDAPVLSTIVDTPTATPAQSEDVPGLGDLPESWGTLPANASLQQEISWVSANRLRVRSGTGVDLSRALSPAPSYSALSWLETSILFPSKFADISVKATAGQEDEREHVRREKLAIEEIRSLLSEMLEG
jgi:hypothetical protein